MNSISVPENFSSPLLYGTTNCLVNGKTRYIFRGRQTKKPVTAISLYEAYLSQVSGSPNTVRNSLSNLGYVFTWAELNTINLGRSLCRGEVLKPRDIRAFSHWLGCRKKQIGDKSKSLAIGTFNHILSETSRMIVYFVSQYAIVKGELNDQIFHIEMLIKSVKDSFARLKRKDRKTKIALDLSEQQIEKIEEYLKPDNRNEERCVALRDYIIWRLVIEFGVRIGEVLALRIQDCPHQLKDTVSIVRIDERGDDYIDPRGEYSPRPKTLSRSLGFILSDSPLKAAISEYCMLHRRRKVVSHDQSSLKMVIDKPDFLILSHHNHCGAPLPMSTAQNISAKISKAVGFSFNWHLGRHAFFNRAYAAIADSSSLRDRLTDLVYWGGWSDSNSLYLYINRALQYRAEKALMFWQTGENSWGAVQ